MRGIEEIIRQAMQNGAFENLPGKGRPLSLEENPYLDREWQLAYQLLKQNGFAPDFIERRQQIELELANARQSLARAWAWRQQALAEGKPADWVEAEWGRAKREFLVKLNETNSHIREYNLQIPTQSLYRMPVRMDAELKKHSG